MKLLWNKNFATNDLVTVDAFAFIHGAKILIGRQCVENKRRRVRDKNVREFVAGEKIFVVDVADFEVDILRENIFLTVIDRQEDFRTRIDVIFDAEQAGRPAVALIRVQ